MLDKDELARRRALHPHVFSVVDSWAKYVATGNLTSLQEELASNPDREGTNKGLLHFAFGDRDLQVLEMLEQSGFSFQEDADVWSIDSLLCKALENGGDCPDVIRWLLDHGAHPLRCTMNRWTSLHLAAIRNYPGVISVLLERVLDIDVGTEIDGDWTPLMEAARAGAADAVALLLKHGADPNRSCGMIGTTVLEIARRKGDTKIVEMLEAATRKKR